MAATTIEWTDATWNPVRGCTPVSAGCDRCYARRIAERFRGVVGHPYEHGFDVRTVPEKLEEPLHWRNPRMVFVNSMSDLFHPQVPSTFLRCAFDVMKLAHWHTFQVLTKRPIQAFRVCDLLKWPSNVWLGVSVENGDYTDRLDALRLIPAKTKFVSFEPLLGPIPDVDLRGIDWAIVGGETGAGARPMRPQWVKRIRDRCVAKGVPFFFKQWGGTNKKLAGRELDGREWNEYPKLKGTIQ